ncbi:hypothetical protein BaRGS_00027897, partial [Batillaria attramentaria]
GPVTKQPGAQGVMPPPSRDWSVPLFGCMEDPGACAYVCCCSPCASMEISKEMGEHPCLCCVMQLWHVALRMKLRMKLGIQ